MNYWGAMQFIRFCIKLEFLRQSKILNQAFEENKVHRLVKVRGVLP